MAAVTTGTPPTWQHSVITGWIPVLLPSKQCAPKAISDSRRASGTIASVLQIRITHYKWTCPICELAKLI